MRRIDRVVVINDYAEPEGGAGVLALESVKQYRRMGYPVTFLTGQGSTPELEAMNVNVVGLNSKRLLDLPTRSALQQGYHNRNAERMVAQWVDEFDTPRTVYHMHNWSQMLSPAIFRALRPVEVRSIITCHDFFNVCPNGGFIHYGRSEPCELRPLSARCVLSQCDRRNAAHKLWRIIRHAHLNRMARFPASRCTFTFIHDRMRERFLRGGFPAADLVTVPNPVEPWSRERIPAETNSGFLFVGRIGLDKGADIALKGGKQAGKHITMIGTGELQADLQSAYPQSKFTGWCQRQQIIEHARHARALIVPSRVIEPFGLVICEAAMSGLPVIVSDRAYMAEDVESGGFGRKFDVGDDAALSELLKSAFDSNADVKLMSQRGFETASSLCQTPDGWINAFIDIFERKLSLLE